MSRLTLNNALGIAGFAALLAANGPASAEERQVLIKVDPTKETTLTIKPFAADLSKTTAAPADISKPLASCSASVTYNNGVTDADCSVDW